MFDHVKACFVGNKINRVAVLFYPIIGGGLKDVYFCQKQVFSIGPTSINGKYEENGIFGIRSM